MLCSTARRVCGEIDRFPLSTYDTVLGATPAARATSMMVTTEIRPLAEVGPSWKSALMEVGAHRRPVRR
jgi:hypothetical protein